MEEHFHDHSGHEHTVIGELAVAQPCKACGQTLTPLVIYLHPEQKAELEWLEKDRKKDATSIIEHFIHLEHGKRKRAAAQRVRPQKA
jgi:hypothetical protein